MPGCLGRVLESGAYLEASLCEGPWQGEMQREADGGGGGPEVKF